MDKHKQQPLKENEFIIDMPDVSDIPGQENVHPPRMREMEDVTISSADEEGEGILDEVNGGDAPFTDDSSNVGALEAAVLRKTDRVDNDENRDLRTMRLDSTDGDDAINEEGDARDFGGDLDVPGAESDDQNEELGEEDEENNAYSRPD